MEQSVLEMLKRCYAGSREPVLLLDDKWNVLWQNVPLEIGYVPALLRIPEDFRETRVGDVEIRVTDAHPMTDIAQEHFVIEAAPVCVELSGYGEDSK